MTESVPAILARVRRDEPGALGRLFAHPRVKEIVRVRAHKIRGFPWERITDRRLDAQRAVWDVVSSIDEKKAAKLRTEGVTLAYVSTGVRNRLFRQVRTDLGLKEATVLDDRGERRFQLVPKIVRESFETALAQADSRSDPYEILAARESLMEVAQALRTATPSHETRDVMRWRIAGVSGREMAARLGKSEPTVYALLRQGRQAVRDQLYRIRTGAR